MNKLIAEALTDHILQSDAKSPVGPIAIGWAQVRPFLCLIAGVSPDASIPPQELALRFIDGMERWVQERERFLLWMKGSGCEELMEREKTVHLPLWEALRESGWVEPEHSASVSGVQDVQTRLAPLTAFAALVHHH